MRITADTDAVPRPRISAIVRRVGLGERPPEAFRHAFARSSHVRFAWHGEEQARLHAGPDAGRSGQQAR